MKNSAIDLGSPNLRSATIMVFFTTFALLLFQILQSVTLSLQIFHNTAFLAISLCMFGLGGGGSLAAFLEHRGLVVTQRTLWTLSLAYACSLLAAGLLTSRMNSLSGLIFTGFLPYLLAGVLLPMTFRTWPRQAGKIYFFDLIGSGLGALMLVILLNGLGDAGKVSLIATEIALLGALACAIKLSRSAVLITLIVAIGTATLFPFTNSLFPYQPGEEKRYGQILRNSEVESTLDWSRWGFLGRLDSVIPGKGINNFDYFGDLVLPDGASDSETRLLFASGDNWSGTINFNSDEAYRSKFLKQSGPAASYIFLDKPDVLNIGLGGGIDLFLALTNEAQSVTGVEINPLMIEAVRDRHRGFFDDPYHNERFTVHEMDGRTFVNQTKEKFDLITLTAVDTGAGLGAGAYVLSENYLYTQEAFDAYLNTLKPGGILFVYRPTTATLRVLVTATAALRKRGIEDPEKHIALFGGEWKGTIISVDPLPSEKIEAFDAAIKRGEFGGNLHYLPGKGLEKAFPYKDLLSSIISDEEVGFLRSSALDFSPVLDDRPFFYQYGRAFFSSKAGKMLLNILTIISIGAALLILLPLLGIRGKFSIRKSMSTLGYFTSIGFGFMLVEVALVQKLVLFLGHPAYSLTVTLFVMLVFSGLGSLFIDRFSRISPVNIASIVPGILAVLLFYAFGLDSILESLSVSSLLSRAVVTTLLLAPGSFLMGMLLPSMIRLLGNRDPILISWAWGVNALASVIASILALIISMLWGYTVAILCGALCYIGAAIFSIAFGLEEDHETPA